MLFINVNVNIIDADLNLSEDRWRILFFYLFQLDDIFFSAMKNKLKKIYIFLIHVTLFGTSFLFYLRDGIRHVRQKIFFLQRNLSLCCLNNARWNSRIFLPCANAWNGCCHLDCWRFPYVGARMHYYLSLSELQKGRMFLFHDPGCTESHTL